MQLRRSSVLALAFSVMLLAASVFLFVKPDEAQAAPPGPCFDCQGLVCVDAEVGFTSCTQLAFPWECVDGGDICWRGVIL